MKSDMNIISRKMVLLLLLVIWQSSLGTTYAKADLSNAATKSFGSSSSYIKFNNGLLIQWGTRSGVTSWTNLYLPISFYDINYTIQMTGNYGNKAETVIYVPMPFITKYTSYFQFGTPYTTLNRAFAWTTWSFNWFAIGRWK